MFLISIEQKIHSSFGFEFIIRDYIKMIHFILRFSCLCEVIDMIVAKG